jgi:alpha-tubulin suppressor-like RCC1 family protein
MMSASKRWMLTLVVTAGVLAGVGSAASAQIRWPRPLPNPEDFIEITAGNYHTCARKNNGNVYCWGRANVGQVGTGADGTGAIAGRAGFVMAARRVDAGADHTCAIDFAGAGFCWGSNQWGALGANQSMAAQQGWGADHWPVPIRIDGGLTLTSLSAGSSSSCATATIGLFCWGKMMTPPGGAGMSSPVQVIAWTGYSNASAGSQHACVMQGFSVHCWGDGSKGQTALDPNYFYLLGFPSLTMFGNYPSRVSTQVNFTCVDHFYWGVSCAGDNYYGQLGNGSVGMPASTPYPQMVGNGMALRGVTTGLGHACALDPNGAAFCWGGNWWGQLGTGTASTGTATAVRGGFTFRAIAAGMDHTCGIATNNQIYCWGSNTYGQLGINRVASPNYFTEPSPWDPVKFY